MRNKKNLENIKKANKHNVASPAPANVASGTWKCKHRSTNSKISKDKMMSDATEKQKETGIATRCFYFQDPPGRRYHAQDMGAVQ